jgi:hypothetical protein
MATLDHETPAAGDAATRSTDVAPNGAAMAAFLAAGIGAVAMGLILVLGELGILSIPALYAPAGGVTGRTTLAVAVWVIAWAVLHARWKDRDVGTSGVALLTFVLIALGVLGTFPPLWGLLGG